MTKHSMPTLNSYPLSILVMDTAGREPRFDHEVAINDPDALTLWVKKERDTYLEKEHRDLFPEFLWQLASFIEPFDKSGYVRNYFGLAEYDIRVAS